jgi:hypothetical protein
MRIFHVELEVIIYSWHDRGSEIRKEGTSRPEHVHVSTTITCTRDGRGLQLFAGNIFYMYYDHCNDLCCQ